MNYQANFWTVAGILICSAIDFLTAIIRNLIRAFIKHGGVAVIGLHNIEKSGQAGEDPDHIDQAVKNLVRIATNA